MSEPIFKLPADLDDSRPVKVFAKHARDHGIKVPEDAKDWAFVPTTAGALRKANAAAAEAEAEAEGLEAEEPEDEDPRSLIKDPVFNTTARQQKTETTRCNLSKI